MSESFPDSCILYNEVASVADPGPGGLEAPALLEDVLPEEAAGGLCQPACPVIP